MHHIRHRRRRHTHQFTISHRALRRHQFNTSFYHAISTRYFTGPQGSRRRQRSQVRRRITRHISTIVTQAVQSHRHTLVSSPRGPQHVTTQQTIRTFQTSQTSSSRQQDTSRHLVVLIRGHSLLTRHAIIQLTMGHFRYYS